MSGFAALLATYAAFNLRAFFARAGNLLSTENPTFSARMMVAIVSNAAWRPVLAFVEAFPAKP